MVRLPWLVFGAAFALAACGRAGEESAANPLPTRQTTIDPVNARLDAARAEGDRRRHDIDNAAQ